MSLYLLWSPWTHLRAFCSLPLPSWLPAPPVQTSFFHSIHSAPTAFISQQALRFLPPCRLTVRGCSRRGGYRCIISHFQGTFEGWRQGERRMDQTMNNRSYIMTLILTSGGIKISGGRKQKSSIITNTAWNQSGAAGGLAYHTHSHTHTIKKGLLRVLWEAAFKSSHWGEEHLSLKQSADWNKLCSPSSVLGSFRPMSRSHTVQHHINYPPRL